MDVEGLARTFVDMARSLAGAFDTPGLLYVLTSGCVEVLGVDAAGLFLGDDPARLQLMSLSSHSPGLVHLLETQATPGPCVECYRSGEAVRLADIDPVGSRWPDAASGVAEAGYASLTALPMRLPGQVIEVLVLFGTTRNRVGGQAVQLAQALADAATIAIVTNRVLHEKNMLAEQLQTALDSRVPIEQAKGVLSHQLSVEPEEAFELLRQRARDTRRRLDEIAEDVVRGNLSDFTSDPLPPGPGEGR